MLGDGDDAYKSFRAQHHDVVQSELSDARRRHEAGPSFQK
jgi:hypothetical protein